MTFMQQRAPQQNKTYKASTLHVTQSSEKPALSHVHFKALDGLRGIAILLVLMCHMAQGDIQTSVVMNYLVGLAEKGWLGVDLFFVLSGFLITGILLDTREKPHFFRNFYMRRVLRIFPLYNACLLAVLVVLPLCMPTIAGLSTKPLQNPMWLFGYGTNIYMVMHHTWGVGSVAIQLPHLWSLAVEEHFYMVWPLLIFFLPRRWLAGMAIAIILGVEIFRCAWLASGGNVFPLYLATPLRIDGMGMGALVAILWRSVQGQNLLAKWTKPTLLCSGAAFFVFVLAVPSELYGRIWPTISYSIPVVFFGSLLVVTMQQSQEHAWNRLMSTQVLRFFGTYSYGIYIFHSIALYLVKDFRISIATIGPIHSQTACRYIVQGSAVLVSIGVAVASYHLFEKPFLRLKRFFAD